MKSSFVVNRCAIDHDGLLFGKDGEALVVRVKLGPTARRQAQTGENVPRTARLGLAPRLWASA